MNLTHLIPKNRQFYKREMHIKRSCVGVLFMCLAVHSGCYSQDSFKESLKIKNDSIIQSFKDSDKGKILNLLPQVSYDALNNSFNVGFSLNGLANFYQQKQRNKIELAKLESILADRMEKEVDKLEIKTEQFKIDYLLLANKIELFKYDFDLFQISKGKYENKEITSEEFLKLKQSYLIKKNSLKTDVLKLNIKALAIAQKTKSDTLQMSLNILSNSINNYND
jgi:hypothetical protein